MASESATASGLDDRTGRGLRSRRTDTASRDDVVLIDHDDKTEQSSDPSKKNRTTKASWRGEVPNLIAVISLLLNLAVAIPFGYLSFWGSRTAEEDASKASMVAAKLARWQNCIDHADHPVCASSSEGQGINPANSL
jgi:hypothetical protein